MSHIPFLPTTRDGSGSSTRYTVQTQTDSQPLELELNSLPASNEGKRIKSKSWQILEGEEDPNKNEQEKALSFHKYVPKSLQKLKLPFRNNPSETGWKVGIRWSIYVVVVCFVVNLTLTIVAISTSRNLVGIGTIYTGDCKKVSRINSVAHVFINILSTALLGCSNYVMQCLGAPTREQVDKAHHVEKSFDIGIPSVGNMFRVGWRRAMLWIVLWISSFPLHFFWNSVVFSTLQANQFIAVTVASDFNSTAFTCNSEYMSWSDRDSMHRTGIIGCPVANDFAVASQNSSNWERLENKACIKKYSAGFISGRRNLLLVSNITKAAFSSSHDNESSTFGALESSSWDQRLGLDSIDWLADGWLCKYAGSEFLDSILEPGQSCSSSVIASHAAEWRIKHPSGDFPVQYCLSEKLPELCKVQSANILLLGITFLNLCKLACMVYGTFLMGDKPLIVIGDAAASFLRHPVQQTANKCLWTGRMFKKTVFQRIRSLFRKDNGDIQPIEWKATKARWFSAAPRSNWFWYFMGSLVSLMVLSGGIGQGLASMSSDERRKLLNSKLGAINPSSAFSITTGDYDSAGDFRSSIQMAMAANSPQVLFVFFYYMTNRLLTCMFGADEWTRFAFRRRALRVSYPTGQQRSTYWLHLPYTYSIPLLVVSTLTHFFISQSLFLVRVWIYDWQGNIRGGDAFGAGGPLNNALGYSATAILTSLSFMAVIFLFVVGMGFRKFDIGPPLAASNSLAISAACHAPNSDVDAAELPVMWGATIHQQGDVAGHCCFTSMHVELPIIGNLYAGEKEQTSHVAA